MISGFRREVGENWVLLGYYTVLNLFISAHVLCIFYYFVL